MSTDPDLSDFTSSHRRYALRENTPDQRACLLPRQLQIGVHWDSVFPMMSQLKRAFSSKIAPAPHPKVTIPVLIEAIWLTWAFASEDVRTLRHDLDQLADANPISNNEERIGALESLVAEQADAIAKLSHELAELRKERHAGSGVPSSDEPDPSG